MKQNKGFNTVWHLVAKLSVNLNILFLFSIVMGLGSLMFTFPHFVTDDYLMKMEENNVSVSLNSEGGQDQLCNR